jgi:hypothetical protein
MGLASLALFMAGMWAMVLAVAAFLVLIVAPLDVVLFGGKAERITVSIIQAAIAVIVVIGLILGLNSMKKIYLQKKIGP